MVQSVNGADVVVLFAQFVVQRLGIQLALLASQLLRPAFTSEAQVLLYLVQVGRQLGLCSCHESAQVRSQHNLPVSKLVRRRVAFRLANRRCGTPIPRSQVLERADAVRRNVYLTEVGCSECVKARALRQTERAGHSRTRATSDRILPRRCAPA